MEWQPIDTAPRDGREVLCYFSVREGWQRMCSWSAPLPHYLPYWNDGRLVIADPSHWMPLPEPPK